MIINVKLNIRIGVCTICKYVMHRITAGEEASVYVILCTSTHERGLTQGS